MRKEEKSKEKPEEKSAKKSIAALGLLLIGTAVPLAAAEAQDQRACRQIRQACQEAGFVQGFAREGIGLQIHCIMPLSEPRIGRFAFAGSARATVAGESATGIRPAR